MSGQSITDRIAAAQHSMTGSAISKAVCKATTHEVSGPKKKHLDCEYANLLFFFIHMISSRVLFKSSKSYRIPGMQFHKPCTSSAVWTPVMNWNVLVMGMLICLWTRSVRGADATVTWAAYSHSLDLWAFDFFL